MPTKLKPGETFPDYELPEHTGARRRVSELQGADPLALMQARGGYCPKEHQQHVWMAAMAPEVTVGYCRFVSLSTDTVLASKEWRQRLEAHWPFLSAEARVVQRDLDIRGYTDPQHDPMVPHTILLAPGLVIYKVYQGYWYWGHPTPEEIRQDFRALTKQCRGDWESLCARAQGVHGIRARKSASSRHDVPPGTNARAGRFSRGCALHYTRPPSPMSRRFRHLTVLLSLWALLWSNGALAGYACPGSGKAFEVAQMVEAGLPCAQEMSQALDEEAPQLCHAHCQSDHQSADTASPAVFATLEKLGPVLTLAPVRLAAPPGAGFMVSQLRRDTAPPLALRHCCLRT